MTASSIVAKETIGGLSVSAPELEVSKKDPAPADDSSGKKESRPLDKLLSQRSKAFRDWKEEREYLRRKWGPQGRRIELGKNKAVEESTEEN